MPETEARTTTKRCRRRRLRQALPGPLALVAMAAALLVALPILAVLLDALGPSGEVWAHVAGFLVPRYLLNTAWLLLGVGGLTTAIGVGAAWLVVTYRFPARPVLEWGLVSPLAIPSYVQAYLYYELTNVSGPAQSSLRALTGLEVGSYWFPTMSSVPGAILVLTLALYPYVYLAARSAFLMQTGTLVEIGRMLGCTPTQAFFRVTLPLSRPAIVVGVSLVAMETLADYGAVSLLGVQTFTTGIYKAWFSMGDRVAAAQLASILLLFVLALVLIERAQRRGQYFNTGNDRLAATQRLEGPIGLLALLACCVPAFLGFVLPTAFLVWLLAGAGLPDLAPFVDAAGNTLLIALLTAGLAVGLGLVIVYASRIAASPLARAARQMASMGYAVPGPVLAIGTLVPLAAFDNALNGVVERWLGIHVGLLLTGSVGALVFAYLARFMTVSIGAVEAGLLKIRPSLEEAASILGLGMLDRLRRVHARLIGPSLATAGLLVFVDVMKELPATLILRPFDFDTLAVRVFNLARDERLAEAALPALALILVGLLPVILLSRQLSTRRQASSA